MDRRRCRSRSSEPDLADDGGRWVDRSGAAEVAVDSRPPVVLGQPLGTGGGGARDRRTRELRSPSRGRGRTSRRSATGSSNLRDRRSERRRGDDGVTMTPAAASARRSRDRRANRGPSRTLGALPSGRPRRCHARPAEADRLGKSFQRASPEAVEGDRQAGPDERRTVSETSTSAGLAAARRRAAVLAALPTRTLGGFRPLPGMDADADRDRGGEWEIKSRVASSTRARAADTARDADGKTT